MSLYRPTSVHSLLPGPSHPATRPVPFNTLRPLGLAGLSLLMMIMIATAALGDSTLPPPAPRRPVHTSASATRGPSGRPSAPASAQVPGVAESLPPGRPISAGFYGDVRLREAVTGHLIRLGRYRLMRDPQIPPPPAGWFVSGAVTELRPSAGWMDCRVHFLVAGQSASIGPVVHLLDTVAASVPQASVANADDRILYRQEDESNCLDESARLIALHVAAITH